MMLYEVNDDEDDLNSVGKYDLKASYNGHSCWRFKLDCPHQAVLSRVNEDADTDGCDDGCQDDHLLDEAKNANEDCENPFPGWHC